MSGPSQLPGLINELERVEFFLVLAHEDGKVTPLRLFTQGIANGVLAQPRHSQDINTVENAICQSRDGHRRLGERLEGCMVGDEQSLDDGLLRTRRRDGSRLGGQVGGEHIEGNRSDRGDLKINHRVPEAHECLDPLVANAA